MRFPSTYQHQIKTSCFQHASLDGTDVQTISSRLIRHPFSLVVYKQSLFVTDWRLDAIIQMDKLTGKGEEIVEKVEESNRLYGIKIFSEDSQLIIPDHPCHGPGNGGCAKLCFPVPDNTTSPTGTIIVRITFEGFWNTSPGFTLELITAASRLCAVLKLVTVIKTIIITIAHPGLNSKCLKKC